MSSTFDPIAAALAAFQRDTARHEMTVLHDRGLYRHVRFQAPGTGIHRYDLVTWPGHLTICGDMDTFTFARVPDMFEFFRTDRDKINPSYWSEKITSGGRHTARGFSTDAYKAAIIEEFVNQARHGGGVPAGTGRAIRERLLADETLPHDAHDAYDTLNEFQHPEEGTHERCQCTDKHPATEPAVLAAGRACRTCWGTGTINTAFQLTEIHDTAGDFSDWTHHFLWACHAIAAGIGHYDTHRAHRAAAVLDTHTALMFRLAHGEPVAEAARAVYLSIRQAWRVLAEARGLYGVATNTEAIDAWAREHGKHRLADVKPLAAYL